MRRPDLKRAPLGAEIRERNHAIGHDALSCRPGSPAGRLGAEQARWVRA